MVSDRPARRIANRLQVVGRDAGDRGPQVSPSRIEAVQKVCLVARMTGSDIHVNSASFPRGNPVGPPLAVASDGKHRPR
ncbi:MAG: hypothetical protein AVDCRST_MAG70-1568 [uncultured Thermomicrobiales bacterium]|uniref:Uncharacterized protein n=1 Tax=uncultured Thermomicrobiales bacterium TaxID=1645740 RepID=A0A6J4UVL9_9BACT|nr:MAG: hypothetical protein AVDCRST_MAG70-1568 [uncultured Thermomicrobiales bacterium]